MLPTEKKTGNLIVGLDTVEYGKAYYFSLYIHSSEELTTNQSGAAEAWWAHNPQVPGSKPGSDIRDKLPTGFFAFWALVPQSSLIK